jgi:hypothetical protein
MGTKTMSEPLVSPGSQDISKLLDQYGCGPVQFAGTGNAFYECHLQPLAMDGSFRDAFRKAKRHAKSQFADWLRSPPAAPAYQFAKLIIKFINNLAGTIDGDPAVLLPKLSKARLKK